MDSRNNKSSEVLLVLKPSSYKDYFSNEKLRLSSWIIPKKNQSTSICTEKPANREKISEHQQKEDSESEDAFENTIAESKNELDKVSVYPDEYHKDIFGPLTVNDRYQDKRMPDTVFSTRNSSAENINLMEDQFQIVNDKQIELPYTKEPSQFFKTHSRYRNSGKKTLISVTKRKIARCNLTLVKLLNKKGGNDNSKFTIRQWKDMDGKDYYDCSCDGRLPSSL